MTTTPHAYDRIDLRTPHQVKELIARAAATAGVSLSAFLIAAGQERARQVLAETEFLTLTPRDWDAFVAALDNVGKPRAKLESAANVYLGWRNRKTD